MALKTLEKLTDIGGFQIVDSICNDMCTKRDGSFDWDKFDALRKDYPIHITHEKNMISFKIQEGPIKEFGENGCQLDTIVETAKIILEGLNKNFPCRENAVAITKLDEALMWLEKRTKDRVLRDVEGKNEA